MERQFFSGNTIEQAVMAAARHYGLEPERIAYKTRDKKHGFLNIRRRVVIEVDPEAPEKPETPAEELVEGPGEAAAEAREYGESDKSDKSDDFANFDSDGFDSDDLDLDSVDSDDLDSDGFDSDDLDLDSVDSDGESRFAEPPRQPPRGRSARTRSEDGDDELWRCRSLLEEEFAEVCVESGAGSGAEAAASGSAEASAGAGAEDNARNGSGDGAGDRAKQQQEIAAFEMALDELMDLVEMEFEANVAWRDGVFEIVLEGEDGEYLVEREGLLLRSIEHLLPRLVRGFLGYGLPCRVDCNGFQEGREAEIREIAGGMAELARRQGKPQKLKPMSPADRRLVHLALADDPTIHTESEGSGYMKRVRVSPV